MEQIYNIYIDGEYRRSMFQRTITTAKACATKECLKLDLVPLGKGWTDVEPGEWVREFEGGIHLSNISYVVLKKVEPCEPAQSKRWKLFRNFGMLQDYYVGTRSEVRTIIWNRLSINIDSLPLGARFVEATPNREEVKKWLNKLHSAGKPWDEIVVWKTLEEFGSFVFKENYENIKNYESIVNVIRLYLAGLENLEG